MGSTLRKTVIWCGRRRRARCCGRSRRSQDRSRPSSCPQDIGDDDPCDGVEPAALMPDRHVLPGIWTPVKGYDRLLTRLRSLGYRDIDRRPGTPPGNLLPVAYDWRLSYRHTGPWLGAVVEPALERWRAQGGPYADAQLVFVCHSMGGLVARWYIEHCGGATITRKLVTLGTPYRGAAKALEQLVNGVHRGIGSLAIDLSKFARSLPSLHQLLPEYACIDHRRRPREDHRGHPPRTLRPRRRRRDALSHRTGRRRAPATRQPDRHPRDRRHQPTHHDHRPDQRRAHRAPTRPTSATSSTGTPPYRSSAPVAPTYRWAATPFAASPTNTATSTATPPHSTNSKASSPPRTSTSCAPGHRTSCRRARTDPRGPVASHHRQHPQRRADRRTHRRHRTRPANLSTPTSRDLTTAPPPERSKTFPPAPTASTSPVSPPRPPSPPLAATSSSGHDASSAARSATRTTASRARGGRLAPARKRGAVSMATGRWPGRPGRRRGACRDRSTSGNALSRTRPGPPLPAAARHPAQASDGFSGRVSGANADLAPSQALRVQLRRG